MSIDIKVTGGTKARLLTAGKYCADDIVVTAEGGGGSPNPSEPVIEPLTVTENGTYITPSGVDGYSPVTVSVPETETQEKTVTITENGTTEVTPDEGKHLSKVSVEVNVAGSGGETSDMEAQWIAAIERGSTKVTKIPDGVTNIGSYAFQNCTNLALTSLPAGLTSIGSYAFDSCSNLALTSLPAGLTSIGSYAFDSCSNLALTSLPAGLTSIGSYAFRSCTNLALTSLPDGLISIDPYAFSGCTNLALTSLPDGLISIGNYAFQNCTNLALTSLPAGTSIGSYAFRSCTNLALTSLPDGVTNIGNYAFQGCTNLAELTFEGTLSTIPSNVFNGCKNLLTINVPWAEGAVANAPWGATNATINYNYTGEG